MMAMRDAQQTLEQYFLEMRWRCLSLAADLDRVERAAGGRGVVESDPRLQKLRQALGVVIEGRGNRAEQVQMIFSDKTPPPGRGSKVEGRGERVEKTLAPTMHLVHSILY